MRGLSTAVAGMSVRDDTGGGADTPSEGLAHLVPPSLRTALGLDANGGGAGERSAKGVSDEDDDGAAPASSPGAGKRSDVCFASEGWGQPNALVVSGGCDKVLRVWDVKTGCAGPRVFGWFRLKWLMGNGLFFDGVGTASTCCRGTRRRSGVSGCCITGRLR